MGKLINYLEYKEKLQKELCEFLAALEEYAQANGTTIEDELANLDPVEQEYYDHLFKMLKILERWEEIDRARQKPKRRRAKDKKNRVNSPG